MKSRALALVVRALTERRIAHALMGATAMPVYGAARATVDADLLVFDPTAFEDKTWTPLRRARLSYEIRLAHDETDPVVGVVRVARRSQLPVDVVMPRGAWLRGVLGRARKAGPQALVAGVRVKVVTLPDLVLLKLDAGGPDDLRDVKRLLVANEDRLRSVVTDLERTLPRVPDPALALWANVKRELNIS